MSRTIIGLVAVGVAVIAIALGVAWRGKLNDQAVIGQNAAQLLLPPRRRSPCRLSMSPG
jgi:hypothetical protein